MFSEDKMENGLLRVSHVKKQKRRERSLYDSVEANFYKRFTTYELRWRLLVF